MKTIKRIWLLWPMLLLALALCMGCSEDEQIEDGIRETVGDTGTVAATEPITEVPTDSETEVETEHTHEFSDWKNMTEPTCTKEGKRKRTCDCGEVEEELIPAAGHAYIPQAAQVTTCVNGGCDPYEVCTVCGHSTKEPKAAPGHDFSGEDGSCTRCGKKVSQGLAFLPGSDEKSYIVVGIGVCTDTDILIPTEHEGNPVVGIGEEAFRDCVQLTGIEIPSSVTDIGEWAFMGCTGLTSIVVADGNPIYCSNGSNCIIETKAKSVVAGCKTGVIPTDYSVTRIGYRAFAYCSELTSIAIPDSITRIDDYAFAGCTGLTSIDIPKEVTRIGQGAFYGCTGLTGIVLPEKVTAVDYHAFSGCSRLTEVVFTGKVTSIGYHAFYDCIGLTSIVLPETVTEIGMAAFKGCTALTDITIPTGLKSMDGEVFSGCTSLANITFDGTKDEWGKIQKGSYWADNAGSFVIHCTDEDISRSDA